MAGIEIGKGKYKADKNFVSDYVDYVMDKKLQEYDAHMEDTSNPHEVTKAQVGLSEADNTSDANKPISNAAKAALDTKADKTVVNAALEQKADKSYVDSGLADKADGAAVYAALEMKADKQNKDGGFCAGADTASITGGAVGWLSETEYGGAVGTMAKSTSGGAVGAAANSTNGGAVGDNAKAGAGFAGGKYARATAANDEGIDAIQLGTGTNSTPKTLQVYDYQLMDENGKIPGERLDDALAKQLPHITWGGLDSFTGRAALVHDDEDDITISSAVATNGTRYMRAHLLLQNIYYPIRHDGSIQDEPFQDGNESYLQTLYKLDGTVQQRRYEAYGANPNVWSAWETIGHAHTHANASILSATTAAFTTEQQNRITALESDLDTFYTDLNNLQNTAVTDAPSDGGQYARKNGSWEAVEEGLPLVTMEELDTLFDDGIYGLSYAETVDFDDGYGPRTLNHSELVLISTDNKYGEPNVTQTRYGYDGKVYTRWGYTGNGTLAGTAWNAYKPDITQAIATKTDAGTSFYFGAPGVYSLARTTDAAKQLSFYTPSDEQKTRVNELELYLTVTAGDSVLWPTGTLFAGGEIPTFTPGHYYRVIAEYHPIAQAWCVGVIEDFAAA